LRIRLEDKTRKESEGKAKQEKEERVKREENERESQKTAFRKGDELYKKIKLFNLNGRGI
jgi:hypothetical protein